MSKSDLIIKLMKQKGWSLDEAEEFLADMPEDEPEPEQQARPRLAWEAGDAVMVRRGTADSASRFITAQRNAMGYTAIQQAGLDRGQKLCVNCQNPEDEHVPGCLRDPDNGFNERKRKRAITQGKLPPVS